MTKKPGVTTIATGYYSRSALNTNFEALNDAFDNTLSLDGSTPNSMQGDLDLNGNEIINGVGKFNNLYLNNALVSNLSTAFNFRSAWTGSTSYNLYDVVAESGNSYIALEAHTSGPTFSVDLSGGKWFVLAAKGVSGSGSGDMLAANNLSDLSDTDTAIGNLGVTATATELNYVDGVTSNLQTQLDARNAQNETSWTTGTSTTEGIVSPAKVKAAVLANGYVVPLGKFHVAQQYTSGTTSGTLDTTWRTRDLNTVVEDTGTITASLSNSVVTLGAGTYRLTGRAGAYTSQSSQLELYRTSSPAGTLVRSLNGLNATGGAGHVDQVSGIFTFTGTTEVYLRHTATSASSAGQGYLKFGGVIDTFRTAELIIERLL